jgi:hypothetical protein
MTNSTSGVHDSPLTPEERLAEVLRDRKKLLKETTATVRKGPPTPRTDRGWIDGAPETSTYFAESGLDDEDSGGRFAPRRSFDPVPRQPPNSPWAADVVGIEPPLGECVDWLPCMITRDGDDQRGLTPWEYGPTPTGAHSALDTSPSHQPDTAEGVRTSSDISSLVSETAEPATQISVAGAGSALPSITSRPPEVQPQLEPNDVLPTQEETE